MRKDGRYNLKKIEEIKEKYSESVLKNLNKENFYRIYSFLRKEKCNFIDDIVSDYLDLFNFNYDEFVKKYIKLNEKYNKQFLNKVSEDMNLLEEFYNN